MPTSEITQFFAPTYTDFLQLPIISTSEDFSKLLDNKHNHSDWGRKDETKDSFCKHKRANYHPCVQHLTPIGL